MTAEVVWSGDSQFEDVPWHLLGGRRKKKKGERKMQPWQLIFGLSL